MYFKINYNSFKVWLLRFTLNEASNTIEV